ncbi:phosphodiester glycosidase family protein [Rhodosalinus sediminis]|uniref:phosphodiester glycosidase family protein n=1 Tax=Rhodosalinus sediminis TaxID=1940533 RepID=UPI0023535FD4|nr:phosphodiester glycosidase family protein [Rhodosalinus sediminis]
MRRLRATRAAALAAALAAPLAAPLAAADCRPLEHEGRPYTVCEVTPEHDDLRLFHSDATGAPYGHFGTLEAALEDRGLRLGPAMNAGMYHPDRAPVGLYVEEGEERMYLVTSDGPGNFGLLPNGVLCLRPGRADVIETRAFARRAPACRFATQSGPMLVIDGALHPRFLPDSTSRYIRNGVGTAADGARLVMAISETPVTFHEFGRLFRDALGVEQALYLDGNVSRLHAPGLGRSDFGRPMGPILAVVEPTR